MEKNIKSPFQMNPKTGKVETKEDKLVREQLKEMDKNEMKTPADILRASTTKSLSSERLKELNKEMNSRACLVIGIKDIVKSGDRKIQEFSLNTEKIDPSMLAPLLEFIADALRRGEKNRVDVGGQEPSIAKMKDHGLNPEKIKKPVLVNGHYPKSPKGGEDITKIIDSMHPTPLELIKLHAFLTSNRDLLQKMSEEEINPIIQRIIASRCSVDVIAEETTKLHKTPKKGFISRFFKG